MAENNPSKLGLLGLVGVVAGSMIGGAIFALPSKMAAGAGAVIEVKQLLSAWLCAFRSIFLFRCCLSG